MSYSDPPPPPAYGAPAPGASGSTNKKALWSMILGILGLVCCGFFTGIPAIFLARSAKSEIARTGEGGSGMATAGLVLGIISVVFGIIYLILILTGNFAFDFSTGTTD